MTRARLARWLRRAADYLDPPPEPERVVGEQERIALALCEQMSVLAANPSVVVLPGYRERRRHSRSRSSL